MRKITAAQFKAAVKFDPAWASKLTDPIEITDFCDMGSSRITHLSPLLHFKGKNENGDSASFYECKSLQVAEGNFAGYVWFFNTGIRKIGNLTCGKDKEGNSAYFTGCKFLKIAEGNFPGFVGFSGSGVEKIMNLNCGKNKEGASAYFDDCESLKIAEGHFPGFVGFWNSSIQEIKDLTCGPNSNGIRLNVRDCWALAKIPISFDPKEVIGNQELLEKLKTDRHKESSKRLLSTKEICM